VLRGAGNAALVVGGRYGLGSKEFTPSMVKAVFDNLDAAAPKNGFTVGINDDVSHTSLEIKETIDVAPEGTFRCKFFGLGSDGTVGANNNSNKIIGDHTDMYAQGYFAYDSKKSGGLTVSHLRFGKTPIQSPYLIDQADMVACHNASYVTRYDILEGIKEGGVFLLNSPWSAADMDEMLPAEMKRTIAQKKLRFYNIAAVKIAEDVGMGGHINTVMQSAFFKLANVIPVEDAIGYMKQAVKKTYGKKGDKIVNMNNAAIDAGIDGLVKIDYPTSWANATTGAVTTSVTDDKYFNAVIKPILAQKGDTLPVSAFDPAGVVPTGTTKYEKRGIAVSVPKWIPENCIQCTQCSLVCPHGCIRPVVSKPESLKDAPESFKTIKANGKELAGLEFRIQLSPLDCTGCGNCADICPAKTKALEMVHIADIQDAEIANYEYAEKLPEIKADVNRNTIKGTQLLRPLFEFSGACAGCGETPYIKLVTQLFGDRMIIANATGCTSIYGGSAPTCPYTTNSKGHGPAWANSLFEDNAEFGYGINLAVKHRREKLADIAKAALERKIPVEAAEAIKFWLENMDNGEGSKAAADKLNAVLPGAIDAASCDECKALLKQIAENADIYVKPSVWIFGGDGWAYDIGYGGLDHVLAQGEDVNVLVVDTEVYSNTGGQSSKATPTGSVAKFAAAGKRTKKKDLGIMAATYGYVYVASVNMGANPMQLIKALNEAEAYKGPSLIIAYAPCINHGINMGRSQREEKAAAEAGYWTMYRYNPELAKEGKNPFTLDSKEPTASYQDFISGEIRYSSLKKLFPDIAKELFARAEQEAAEKREYYEKLTKL
jgi:pyruvate-ferredoxin/flavodoxin oxidoreductase